LNKYKIKLPKLSKKLKEYMLTRRFKNFNARLSLDTFNNSMALFSNGA